MRPSLCGFPAWPLRVLGSRFFFLQFPRQLD